MIGKPGEGDFLMKRSLFLFLCLASCTSVEHRAEKCRAFEEARQEALGRGHLLTEAEINRAIVLNDHGTAFCTTSIEELTEEMRGLGA